jgi:hypothetical protein
MPISSAGSVGSGDPSLILARAPTRVTVNPAPANSRTTTTTAGATASGGINHGLTGTEQSKLSDGALAVLIQLQSETPFDSSQIPSNPTRPHATTFVDPSVNLNDAKSFTDSNTSSPSGLPQTATRTFRSHQEEIDAATGRYGA